MYVSGTVTGRKVGTYMRIPRADFEVGHLGRAHQSVLDVIPEEEWVEEADLRAAYDEVREENKPSFEQVMENLSQRVSKQQKEGRVFYIRRKTWLSSAEVARRLQVSMRTVQAWGQKGMMGARYVGDRLRFAADAVEDWVRSDRPSGQGNGRTAQARNTALDQVWNNEADARYE